MYYVYLLTDKNGKKYFGCTSDLKRRFYEHVKGQGGRTTKNMTGIKLEYYEAYNSEYAARTRESKLKKFGSAQQALLKRIGIE